MIYDATAVVGSTLAIHSPFAPSVPPCVPLHLNTMKLPWLAPGTAPQSLQTAVLLCRPLKLADVVKDYDAVMSSRTDIQFVFGPDVDWPTADLSIEQGTEEGSRPASRLWPRVSRA